MAKIVQTNFIENAAKQVLYETLGFDEGKVYYYLLLKKEKDLEDVYSYSKRYRLMKSLFETGAVGKSKPGNQDFFNYFILPPSFLYFNDVDIKIINFLESIYLKNHSKLLETAFTQVILMNSEYLLIFLLKYFMKKNAKLVTDDSNLTKILGDKINNIQIIISRKESKRKLGTIDANFAFEFFNVLNNNSSEYFGYLATNKINESSSYVSRIVDDLKEFC